MQPVIAKLIFFIQKIKYKTIITTETIIAQIDKFVKNSFNFELVRKKDGRTRIKTAIIKIAGII
jgi:hypothetical protein